MKICSKYLDLISDYDKSINIQIESSTDEDKYYNVTIYPWQRVNSKCTCAGYRYRHTCSHIEQVYDNYFCDWNEIDGSEKQNEQGICPRCGAPTNTI